MVEHMFDKIASPSRLPAELEEMPPGPELARLLAAIDVTELSGHDQVIVLRAHQRLANHHTARVQDSIAAINQSLEEQFDGDVEVGIEATSAEIRAALVLTRRSAEAELDLALALSQRLPSVLNLLRSGLIDRRRAWVIVRGTDHLSIAKAREVVDQILQHVPSLTTGQLAARIRKLSIELDPDEAVVRYEEGLERRRVVTGQTSDGTAHLLAFDLPPHMVQAVTRRINEIAKRLRRDGEKRTMDQLRADVLLDLLGGGHRGREGGRGMVDIRVDLTTLIGLTDTPADLAGYGPIVADIARQIADQHNGEWRFAVTDEAGNIETGITRRRPTRAQRRQVEMTQQTCSFPGCRMPSTESDLDHTQPFSEGGPTTAGNLAPLCRHDHRVRRSAGWTYSRRKGAGIMWKTALGHEYTTPALPP